MTYEDVIRRELAESEHLGPVVEALKGMAGKRVLLFSHDDPDGITSAAILFRALRKIGAETRVILPPRYDLEIPDVEAALKDGPADAVVCLDKGTSAKADELLSLVPRVIVIDHHFMQGTIQKALWYNPGELKRPYTSCSFLCHMLATLLGTATLIDDFDAAIGMKSDWAIDPTSGNTGGADFVKPYDDRLRKLFPNLYKLTPGPTLFDMNQRKKSSVMSKIAELYFAVSGGGFQYYYDIPAMKNVDPPTLLLEAGLGLARKEKHLAKVKSVADFLKLLPQARKIAAVYQEYQKTWDKVWGLFENATPLMQLNGATVYLFTTDRLPLMPMVGSLALAPKLARDGVENGVMLMVNRERVGTHFSLRANSDKVHVGRLCGLIASRLVKRFGHPDQITGGGHARAGECKTRAGGVPHLEALLELCDILREMRDLESRRGQWNEWETKTAREYGLA